MKTYFAADHHISHSNIINFMSDIEPTKKLRPFDSVSEMNNTIIANHNRLVDPDDRVYFLGDVVFGGVKNIELIREMNGNKILIAGNHDVYGGGLKSYTEVFDKVLAYKELSLTKGVTGILSHIPVHTQQVDGRFKFNIHGHLHECIIENDGRYLNVGMEQFDYTPVSLDEIKLIFQRRGIYRGDRK